MIGILRVVENNKNDKESVDSEATRVPYTNNVENLSDRRNVKRLSKARDKVLKAASKINW